MKTFKKGMLFVALVGSTFAMAGCGSNLPEVVKNTPGHEKWETKIDYSNKDNWLNLPASNTKNVDVIYYYPTCFTPTGESKVSDIDDAGMRSGAKSCLDSQAKVFEDSCNIYAPYYRQLDANYALTLTDAQNDELFSYAAGKDATVALDYYFTNYNKNAERPFILAGHSQGSETLIYLLQDYFKNHQDYSKKMIAAYVIGYSVTSSYLTKNTHLTFAKNANDTGVIVSWNTEGQENIGKHNAVVLSGAKSINPINWKTDDTYASSDENLGGRIDGKDLPKIADAKVNVERGTVITTAPKDYAMPSATSAIFGPCSYHGNDYGLFFYNIKQNVKDRIDAYFKK